MRMEHVAVYVKNLETAREFFIKYFDAESGEMYHNRKTGFRSYFLSFEDGARLEIMTRPEIEAEPKMEDGSSKRRPAKPLIAAGYIHLAFSVGSKEAVDALTSRMKADGYDVVSGPRTTGDGYYESCVVGIEGNQIEITV